MAEQEINFKVSMDDANEYVLSGNVDLLTSLISNPLINAMYAVRESSQKQITVRLSRFSRHQKHFLQLEIEDTGCGISEDKVERIFDPLYSTKGVEGTGLGLSIVKHITHFFNGMIDVHSSLGIGNKFSIKISRK